MTKFRARGGIITAFAAAVVVLLNIGLVTGVSGSVHTPSRSTDDLTMRSLVERQLVSQERAVYVELRELAPESHYRITGGAAAFQGGRAGLWLSGIAQAASWASEEAVRRCDVGADLPLTRAGAGRFFDWELYLVGDGRPAVLHVVNAVTFGDETQRLALLVVDEQYLGRLVCEDAMS